MFCFGYRLSKHEITRYVKNFGGAWPFAPPCYAYAPTWQTVLCWKYAAGRLHAAINDRKFGGHCHEPIFLPLLPNSCAKRERAPVFTFFESTFVNNALT